jgi:hypothetical protein
VRMVPRALVLRFGGFSGVVGSSRIVCTL